MTKRALILGITGQDGSYLADILLEKGYEVHGLVRRSSTGNLRRIEHILDRVTLHRGDLLDSGSVEAAIRRIGVPDEIYNEADQDAIDWSHAGPMYSCQVTFSSVMSLLELVRKINPYIRVFQPASATIFGDASAPQNETTPLNPLSPYACCKAGAYHLARYYRQHHDMFVSTAILYNHDSPRRSEEYLVHKICRSAIRMSRGEQDVLKLGNLNHQVDIGHAREYMEAAWQMMQLDEPDDFVIGTGQTYQIGNLAGCALRRFDLSFVERLQEDPNFRTKDERKRQTVHYGDITKAKNIFGFSPKLHGGALVNHIIDEMLEEERCHRRD